MYNFFVIFYQTEFHTVVTTALKIEGHQIHAESLAVFFEQVVSNLGQKY